MKPIALVAVVALAGCGPLPDEPFPIDVSVEVENQYAESLFTVDWQATVDGVAQGGRIMDSVRIRSYGTSLAKAAFQVPSQTPTRLVFSAVSLGEVRSFAPIDITAKYGTYRIVYDWDFATAAFSISHKWKY
jgi:hypothetical protein